MKEELYIKTSALKALSYYTDLLSEEEINNLYNQCTKNIRGFVNIINVINSNRWPTTVYQAARNFGMTIPQKFLYGTKAYQYFLNNIKEYLKVDLNSKPSIHDIMTTFNLSKYTESFSDDSLLALLSQMRNDVMVNGKVVLDYQDRFELLEIINQSVIDYYGKFEMLYTNPMLCEDEQCTIILFTIGSKKVTFSIEALLSYYDITNNIWYYDAVDNKSFNRMVMMQLKHLLGHHLDLQSQKKENLKNLGIQKLKQKIEKFLEK